MTILTFVELYEQYSFIGVILFVLSFLGRIIVNSKIYNSENGTNFDPISVRIGTFATENYEHAFQCFFTFWILNYNPADRKLVILSNSISAFSALILTVLIVGINMVP